MGAGILAGLCCCARGGFVAVVRAAGAMTDGEDAAAGVFGLMLVWVERALSSTAWENFSWRGSVVVTVAYAIQNW